ncbi:MAG: ABC-type transport system, permease component [Haloplasmataceae bacterium]|jgi:ABC-2 type transport system permease protein|nr:ABC-type transport system, permease component [Haloplasmataceae bacterium]
MFKKYIPFLRANLMTMLTYRGTIIAWFLVETFSLVMMIFLWQTIYKGQSEINGFGINEIIIYFLIVGLLGIFASSDAMYTVSEELKQGQISMYLIKPINYKIRVFFGELGNKIGLVSVMIPVSIIVIFIASMIWNLNFDFTIFDLLLFILFIPLAFLLIYEFSYLFGLLSIYTTNVFGLSILLNIIISITSGQLIPLNFYPKSVLFIVSLMPFQYVYNFPANILLGEISYLNAIIGLLILIVWICFFKVVNHLVFKFNEKKIVIFGG